MNRLLENLYYKSPVALQNLAVSIMGVRFYRERYRPEGKAMFAQLRETQAYSAEEMYEYQSQAFVSVARHALTSTPYYQNWAKSKDVQPGDIRSLADLAHFPVIQKGVIRSNPELFRSQVGVKQQFTLHTSGTTGTPLTVYTDKASRSRHYAFFSRLREQYRVLPIDRRATLFGRIIMPSEQKHAPFWRYDSAQKNLLMSSYHLHEQNLQKYYQKLCQYQPAEIFSYPSSLAVLAEYIVRKQLTPIPLKLVMTTAEKLLDNQEAYIKAAFQAPLVNQYGCTEMAFFAASERDGRMYFHPEHSIVEAMGPDGAINSTGQGQLLATGLINTSMPVIRYATGDDVVLGAPNPHGFTELQSLEGRVDDLIYTRDGTPVGRLDPVFKCGRGVKFAQVEQKGSGDILVRIVPDETYDESKGDSLKLEMLKRVGADLNVAIEICAAIPKESNGKFRPVISHYTPTGAKK